MPPRQFRGRDALMHALIAVCTLFLLVSSWWMMALPLPSKVFTYRAYPFQLHKNVGITMLVFVMVMLYGRIAYLRATRGPASARPRMPLWAVVENILLYGLVVACCLSGYLSSVYSGWTTRLWWLVDLPNWGYDNDQLNDLYADIHTWTTYALVAIIAIHIGTGAYRAFRGERSVRRMLRI